MKTHSERLGYRHGYKGKDVSKGMVLYTGIGVGAGMDIGMNMGIGIGMGRIGHA